ncbi:lamin tail domain-containing protein [Eubacteriaceae bacterium ES3]|nr:lamin tail domain-containing protein [Eubacteriaceae bacterium ES3]
MKKNKVMYKRIELKKTAVFILIILSLFISAGCDFSALDNGADFAGYTLIEVDGGDLSGEREANVVVDVGYGDREYWAFTNEYGQLVKVTAEEIILQDDDIEPVLSTGRYYSDEAKVPGVESPTLDEGHVIADSLGGVSNAYNITPQESTLNRDGDQAYMEKVIRDAGGCTDFTAIITYPSTTTQIPSHYSYTYTLKGEVIHDEFDNVNPDEVNEELNGTAELSEEKDSDVFISELDKKAEYIIIKNTGTDAVDLTDWKIVSVRGNQSFIFPDFSLEPGASVKVGDSANSTGIDFHWLDGGGTWNNSQSDPAELYDSIGQLVDRYND